MYKTPSNKTPALTNNMNMNSWLAGASNLQEVLILKQIKNK